MTESSGYDAMQPVPPATGVLTERIRMAPDGRSYESTIRLAMFDASGKPMMGDGEGTVRARRAGF